MRSRLYKTFRWSVILVPAFVFVCAVVLPLIPGAMGLFSDSAGPWYQPITAPLFFVALYYGYPMMLLCTRLGGDNMFLSPGYYCVLAVYSLLWALLLRRIFSFFERRAARTS
jgi:hypothetical protein